MRDLMRDFSPLADFQAAGAVGNGGGESGGFTIAQEGGIQPPHGGWGGFQWTGPRRRDYEAFITAHGGDMHSERDALNYDMMYGMLKKELEGPEHATILALRQTKDVAEATKMFMLKFERPGVPHYEGRVRWSQMALDAYSAEQLEIWKNPDIQVAQQPAKLPMPSALPGTKEDTKGAAKVVGAGGIGAVLLSFFGSTWVQAALIALAVAAVWWFLVRPIVIRYTSLGTIEAGFLTKLQVALKGIKTKLFAAVLTLVGLATPLISYATDSNLVDMLPTIKGVPPGMYVFGILAVVGPIVNWLRNNTTTAPGQTDLAILPDPSQVAPPPTGLEIDPKTLEYVHPRVSQTKKRRKPRKKKAS